MKRILLVFFLIPNIVLAQNISINCGSSEGYSYYFQGGLVGKKDAGFTTDGITSGQITLTYNTETQKADILTKDATGSLKSSIGEGGGVTAIASGDRGINWIAFYPDGTIEVYSYNFQESKAAIYRNTVGNPRVAKNSLFIASCD